MRRYLVGGGVRDSLLGRPAGDRDWVVVGATPQHLIDLGYKPVGNDFPVFLHPTTREEVYAIYYDDLRRKIEERGTSNFPEAGGKKLYGSLTMVITVNNTGAVLDTEVVQGSGNELLDRRAQAIVKSLSFGNFNEAMRRRADQIVVVSRFRFTREATLQTQISEQ